MLFGPMLFGPMLFGPMLFGPMLFGPMLFDQYRIYQQLTELDIISHQPGFSY